MRLSIFSPLGRLLAVRLPVPLSPVVLLKLPDESFLRPGTARARARARLFRLDELKSARRAIPHEMLHVNAPRAADVGLGVFSRLHS